MAMKGLLLGVLLLIVEVQSFIGHHRTFLNHDNLDAFPAQYKQTPVDHFDVLNNATFRQKWYQNDLYWDKNNNGPVILYINGEGPIFGPPQSQSDEIVLLAQKFKALIVTVEHRYFGESTPFANVTLPNMRFLSSKQALHDLADFIYYVKMTVLPSQGSKNKWLHAGGSYSGALSAWFKIKFPHLTFGAIASSGVVHVIEDFYQFEDQWALSVGADCANQVRKMNRHLDSVWRQDPQGTRKLFSAPTLVIEGDFQKYIADTWIESVQYGYQPEICSAVMNSTDVNLVNTYAKYVNTFFLPTFGMNPATYATAYQAQTKYQPDGSRSWWWLKCSELAWFETPSKDNPIRSPALSLQYYRDHCEQVFGAKIWPNVAETNLNYGGVTPAAHHVVYVEGSQDPWQAASVKRPSTLPEDTEPKIVISCERCAHCVDLGGCPFGKGPNGRECGNGTLTEGRAKIASYLEKWLNESFP